MQRGWKAWSLLVTGKLNLLRTICWVSLGQSTIDISENAQEQTWNSTSTTTYFYLFSNNADTILTYLSEFKNQLLQYALLIEFEWQSNNESQREEVTQMTSL